MAEYAISRFTLLCTMAARLPRIIDSPATTPITGTQPAVCARQAPLPSTPANAEHHDLGKNEETQPPLSRTR